MVDKDHPMLGPNTIMVPFLACGDLSGYDADMTYELPEDYVPHDPVAPPIHPAYEHAKELKRKGLLAKTEQSTTGNTKSSGKEEEDQVITSVSNQVSEIKITQDVKKS
jgi:hypothetical protein